MQRIALDMDDVVVDLLEGWKDLYRKRANIPQDHEIEIKEWNVATSMTELEPHEVFNMLNFPGLFYSCKPVKGAVAGVNLLMLNDHIFDVYFLTAAAGQTAYFEKLRWIEDRFGEAAKNKVIAVPDGKLKNKFSCMFDIFVDDKAENMEEIVNIPDGPLCILYSQKHNENADPSQYHHRVDGWDELLNLILSKRMEFLKYASEQ